MSPNWTVLKSAYWCKFYKLILNPAQLVVFIIFRFGSKQIMIFKAGFGW
jgi:hypothetical protein